MHPRISVRLLLVIVAIFATICYLIFARPTAIADRFVAAINARDYRLAKSFLNQQPFRSGMNLVDYHTAPSTKPSQKVVLIYAEVLPREWNDIWSFQRRLIFRVAFHDDTDGRHIEWAEDTRLVAGFGGVRITR